MLYDLTRVNAFKSERFQFEVKVLKINWLNIELTMPTYGIGPAPFQTKYEISLIPAPSSHLLGTQ
jgi:hypothetical protein